MKSFKIIHESDNCINQIAPHKVRVGRGFRLFFAVFILSSVMILSSCAVGIRTPQRHTSGIIIESHTRVERPERERHIRVVNRHDHRDRREHDRDDD